MQQHISFQGKFQEVFLPGTRERQNVEVMGWRYNYDYDGLQKQPGARGPCLGQQHRFYSPQRVVAIWKRASVPVETRLQRPPLPPPTSLLVLEVVLLDQFQVVHKLVVLFAVGALRENGPLGKGERVHIPNGPPACARNSQSARGRGRGGWRTRQIAGRCTQPLEPPQNPLARRTRRRGLAHTHTRTRARAHTHTHTHTLSLSLLPPFPRLTTPVASESHLRRSPRGAGAVPVDLPLELLVLARGGGELDATVVVVAPAPRRELACAPNPSSGGQSPRALER